MRYIPIGWIGKSQNLKLSGLNTKCCTGETGSLKHVVSSLKEKNMQTVC